MRGRVLQVGRSPRGSITFAIRALRGDPSAKRGRFFAHEAECHPSYKNPQPGDVVEFSTKPPNRENQMPKAVCIRRVDKQLA